MFTLVVLFCPSVLALAQQPEIVAMFAGRALTGVVQHYCVSIVTTYRTHTVNYRYYTEIIRECTVLYGTDTVKYRKNRNMPYISMC